MCGGNKRNKKSLNYKMIQLHGGKLIRREEKCALTSDLDYYSLNRSNGSTFWQNKLVLAFLIILWRPVEDDGVGPFYNNYYYYSTH